MAKITMTFEDQPTTGGEHFEIRIESDPPLPIARVTDPRWLAELGGGREDLDMARATPAQTAARMAAGDIAGHAKAAAIFARTG